MPGGKPKGGIVFLFSAIDKHAGVVWDSRMMVLQQGPESKISRTAKERPLSVGGGSDEGTRDGEIGKQAPCIAYAVSYR